MPTKYIHTTSVDAPVEFAFDWHKRPGAFQRLAPPWEDLEIEEASGGIQDGGMLAFRIKKGPLYKRWVARHYDYKEGEQFCDRQEEGPFARWNHVHRFLPDGDEHCIIRDEVTYQLPAESVTRMLPDALVKDKITAMFAFRSLQSKQDIEAHHRAGLEPKRVLMTGSSGMIGTQLTAFLQGGGHSVTRLLRSRKIVGEDFVVWSPKAGVDEKTLPRLEGHDAVVNLGGENIFGLWTSDKKRRIRESRVNTTRHLCEALAKLEKKPEVLVSASAVGFYGNRSEEELTEESAAGSGYLTEVAEAWEAATRPAEEAGIRVVHLRIGVVLSPQGGALKVMLLPFSLGLGGRLGDGQAWFPWIAIDDVIGLIHWAIANKDVRGPLNAAAPHPVRNAELTRTLASTLRRPAPFPAPAGILKTLGRDMAKEVLLASVRAVPKKALDHGYQFRYRDLGEALRHYLGKNG